MNTGERLKVPSPASDGWATDHLNPEATRAHMKYVVDRLHESFGDLKKSGISNLYLASYEVRGLVWSPVFNAEFRKRRGYDITPYLPGDLRRYRGQQRSDRSASCSITARRWAKFWWMPTMAPRAKTRTPPACTSSPKQAARARRCTMFPSIRCSPMRRWIPFRASSGQTGRMPIPCG